MIHQHPCDWTDAGCTNHVACDAELVANHDGIPDVVCRFMELGQRFECEPCRTGRCEDCRCIVRLEGHEKDVCELACPRCWKRDRAVGPYGDPLQTCADCYDGPADGEAFAGGFAENH